jgi:hypothetical protein
MNKLDDTSPEADRLVTEVFRKMTIGEKWRRLGAIYRTARILHATGVQLRKPGATPTEIQEDWIALTHGEGMLKVLKEATPGFRR